MVAGRGGGGSNSREVIRQVTLVLDGIFFRDGEFVGPDTGKMFEHTVADAEAHRIVTRIAKQGHYKGLSAADILAEIAETTGAAPERPPMPPHLHNQAATKDFLKAALQTYRVPVGHSAQVPPIRQRRSSCSQHHQLG
jgi:hypothetical protein